MYFPKNVSLPIFFLNYVSKKDFVEKLVKVNLNKFIDLLPVLTVFLIYITHTI